jgi:hypothetical protein
MAKCPSIFPRKMQKSSKSAGDGGAAKKHRDLWRFLAAWIACLLIGRLQARTSRVTSSSNHESHDA